MSTTTATASMTPKKRNATDTTLRNDRARRKDIWALATALDRLAGHLAQDGVLDEEKVRVVRARLKPLVRRAPMA